MPVVALLLGLVITGALPPSPQKYAQYIDAESAVVKRPEGPGWDDPFGDGVWRSSWFYSSLLIVKAKDKVTYDNIRTMHGVDEKFVAQFIRYFHDHCTGRRVDFAQEPDPKIFRGPACSTSLPLGKREQLRFRRIEKYIESDHRTADRTGRDPKMRSRGTTLRLFPR